MKTEKMSWAIEAHGGGEDFKATVRKEISLQIWIYGLDLAATDDEMVQVTRKIAGI